MVRAIQIHDYAAEYQRRKLKYSPEETKARRREAYKKNAEKIRIADREFRIRNWPVTLVHKARSNSKLRGMTEFDITPEWVLEQFSIQSGKCFYTGHELRPSIEVRSLYQPSLDRVNNSIGYIQTNVKLTSWGWNVARGDSSIDDTLKFWNTREL